MAGRKIFKGRKSNNGTENVTGSTEPELDNNSGSNEQATNDSDGNSNDSQDDESIITIDPGEFGDTTGSDSSTEPRKRRGRKPGSKNKAKAKEGQLDLAAVLLSLHLMGAKMLQIPEMELDKEEAEEVMSAITRVNELFGGFEIPEKTFAIIMLVFTLIKTYVPRGIAYLNRKKQEKLQEKNKVVSLQPMGVS